MKRIAWTQAIVGLTLLGTSIVTTPVSAHISTKGALQSRGGDQKSSPCDGKRGDSEVYTFAPGATITIAVNEDIPHPSYFRIAFDDDGEDFVEPASIDPIDKQRACPFNKDDQCGKSDYCSTAGAAKGAIVLWDNLDPHLSAAAAGGNWNVKLPDVECENCTIQVLQVMEDTVHGAYCPQGTCANSGGSLEDIYHRCIDIKLVKGAMNGPGVTMAAVANKGMECAASPVAGAAGAAAPAAGTGGKAAGTAGVSAAGASASAAGSGAGGSPATGAAGAATSSTGAAGKPASTTPASAGTVATGSVPAAGSPASTATATTTGAGGSPSTGSATSASTSSPAGTAASQPAPAESSGGCSVSGANGSSNALGLLLSLGWLVWRRRRGSKSVAA